MLKKVLPIMVLGMGAQSYYNQSGQDKEKEVVLDPKTDKQMKKVVAKKKLIKTKNKVKKGK